jgi:hypothetical protein
MGLRSSPSDIYVEREGRWHDAAPADLDTYMPASRPWKAEHGSEQPRVHLARRSSDPLTRATAGSHVKCRALDYVPAIEVGQPDRKDAGGAGALDRHIDPRLCPAKSVVPGSEIREDE